MEEKMIGKIKWFKKVKGYGYIVGADGEEYFFQISNCVNPNEDFEVNDDVLFIPFFGEMDHAESVEKVVYE